MLSKRLFDCVRFANYSAEHNIPPRAVAELVQLADRIGNFEISSTQCNQTDRAKKNAESYRKGLVKLADKYGFKVDFGNPYPDFIRKSDGMQCRPPYLS